MGVVRHGVGEAVIGRGVRTDPMEELWTDCMGEVASGRVGAGEILWKS